MPAGGARLVALALPLVVIVVVVVLLATGVAFKTLLMVSLVWMLGSLPLQFLFRRRLHLERPKLFSTSQRAVYVLALLALFELVAGLMYFFTDVPLQVAGLIAAVGLVGSMSLWLIMSRYIQEEPSDGPSSRPVA